LRSASKFWSRNLTGRETWAYMEDNLKIVLTEIGCESVDWMHMPKDKIQ